MVNGLLEKALGECQGDLPNCKPEAAASSSSLVGRQESSCEPLAIRVTGLSERASCTCSRKNFLSSRRHFPNAQNSETINFADEAQLVSQNDKNDFHCSSRQLAWDN